MLPNRIVRADEAIRRVQGTLERLDCAGKSAILRVMAGSTHLSLLIAEPEKIVLNHGTARRLSSAPTES